MSEQKQPDQQLDLLVSTTSIIPGYRIVAYRGIAYGSTVRSRGMAGEYMAGCQTTCGGEVSAYTTATIESREEAVLRLKSHARQLGANAIVGVRIDSDQLGQGANYATVAYGTAVIIE
ncbi:MAG: YbjQ family protein [Candidatus Heimdallarchaeota archaeon]